MSEKQKISDLIFTITDDIRTIVKGEIELAKAEIIPQIKAFVAGLGMFGVAGYFAIVGAHFLFIFFAMGTAWLFIAQAGFNPVPAIFAGFGIWALIFFILAGVLALLGKINVGKLKGPEKAIAAGTATIDAVKKPFGEKVQSESEAFGDIASRASTVVSEKVDQVKDSVTEARETIKDKAGEAKESLKTKAQEVKTKLGK